MAWPSTVAPHQAASAAQYNGITLAIQTWQGDVSAGGHKLTNCGGITLAANAVLDVSAGGFTVKGGLRTTTDGNNMGLVITSSDASRTLSVYVPPSGASPGGSAVVSSTGGFVLRTSDATRYLAFGFAAGAEELLSTGSGRFRVVGSLDADTDVVAAGKLQGASLNITNAASITFGSNWQAWTPTLTATGSMTVSAVNLLDAQYMRIGPWVFAKVYVAFTLGGTADQFVYISLPVVPTGQPNALAILSQLLSAGYPAPGVAYTDANSGGRILLRYGAAVNYPLGAYNVMVSGFYRCA